MKRCNIKKYFPLLLISGLALSGCGDSGEKNTAVPQSTAPQTVQSATSLNDLKSLTPVENDKLAAVLPETFGGEKRLKLKKGTLYEDISAASADYGAGIESGQRRQSNWDGILAKVSIWDCAGKTASEQSKGFRMRLQGSEEQSRGSQTSTLITVDDVKGYQEVDNGNFPINGVTLFINERYLLMVKSHEQMPDKLLEFIKQSNLINQIKTFK